jgi:dipeptidyl aminopeptidase/acylaminoacyl peptidase
MGTKNQRQRGGASLALAVALTAVLAAACAAEIAYVGVFGGGLAIYVVDEASLKARPLTSGPVDTAPAWSPDGTRIAFARWVGDAPDLFVIDADGTHLTRLTDTPGQDAEPVWKPDGTALAFLSEADGATAAYLGDPDGANLRRFPGSLTGSALWTGRRMANSSPSTASLTTRFTCSSWTSRRKRFANSRACLALAQAGHLTEASSRLVAILTSASSGRMARACGGWQDKGAATNTRRGRPTERGSRTSRTTSAAT